MYELFANSRRLLITYPNSPGADISGLMYGPERIFKTVDLKKANKKINRRLPSIQWVKEAESATMSIFRFSLFSF